MNKSQFSTGIEQNPDEYFAQIRQSLQQQEKKGRELSDEEEQKMQDGFALFEMTKTSGWKVIQDILQGMPKSNVDPRGMKEEDWKFAQLNAFWAGAVASELLQTIQTLISEAHQLHAAKIGEVRGVQRMKV